MSNLKKVVALALALALVMTMFAGATIKSKLPVVDADQFTDAQLSAAALLKPLGVLAGMGADELGAGTVTRAQMVAFIYRLVNGGDNGVQAYYTKTSQYSDVDPEAWYAPYLNWAYAAKVAYGYGETFGPNDPVTGAQAAAMLVRLLGKDASGNDYALKAEANAIALQLDKGIETKGLYENALARGDMFILLANSLLADVKGETLAEKYFDLEVVYGAILLGEDAIGANGYTVFAFRVDTLGNVKYFWTDLLCVEEDSTVFEDYGCKYTLLVSKSQNVQGYRQLYAAYEESQNGYYKVVTGTVDDDKLIFDGKKQNVFYDDNCFFYVDGKKADQAEFERSYGVDNGAQYKLIDNDGDGKYEFAIIERLTLKGLNLETITAKVTAVSANGKTITLTTADGKEYKVKLGEFWNDKNTPAIADDEKTNNIASIQNTLGIDQETAGAPYAGGYRPFTAISDVYYDFGIAGGYLFTIAVSEKTQFAGSYGILVQWSNPVTMYKNMPYALFVNEKSEYFWSYVAVVDEAPAATNWTWVLDNTLVYFTDGDASDDVVSFDTAGFWNSNYTYKELLTSKDVGLELDTGVNNGITLEYPDAVYVRGEKNVPYSDIAKFGFVYAVFEKDPTGKAFWNQADQKYETIATDTDPVYLIDAKFNRSIGTPATPMANWAEVEGKYVVKVNSADQFYGLASMEESLFFEYRTTLKINVKLTIDPNAMASNDTARQIYRRNGFWHLRFWQSVNALTERDIKGFALVIDGKEYTIFEDGGLWYFNPKEDHKDPATDSTKYDWIRVAEVIKGFNDATFKADLDAKVAALVASSTAVEPTRSTYRLLNTSKGVVFAYGDVVEEGATVRRWVAYDIDTFDSDFGYGVLGYDLNDDGVIDVNNDTVPFGYTPDELIFTKVGNTYYVKALKVSDYMGTLPYGWLEPNGYELVIFGGFSGGVNTNGWGIKLVTFDGDKINEEQVYTKIGLGGAVTGNVLLVKRDADKNIIELLAVGNDVWGYLDYATGYRFLLKEAPLVSATKIAGDDDRGDYYEVSLANRTAIYMWVEGGVLHWTTDYSKVPQETGKTPYVNVWSFGNVYVAFVKYYA